MESVVPFTSAKLGRRDTLLSLLETPSSYLLLDHPYMYQLLAGS